MIFLYEDFGKKLSLLYKTVYGALCIMYRIKEY